MPTSNIILLLSSQPNGEGIKQLPLEGYTFEGYRNADGSDRTRNILANLTNALALLNPGPVT